MTILHGWDNIASSDKILHHRTILRCWDNIALLGQYEALLGQYEALLGQVALLWHYWDKLRYWEKVTLLGEGCNVREVLEGQAAMRNMSLRGNVFISFPARCARLTAITTPRQGTRSV